MFGDVDDRRVLVEVSQGQIQGLLLEIEGGVYIDEPVNQNLAHVSSDVHHYFFLFFLLSESRVTWSDSMKERISGSWSMMGSVVYGMHRFSTERDLWRCYMS